MVANGHHPAASWHTHPAPTDDRPSDADLRTWEGYAELLRVRRYLGVIVTPDRDRGWDRPRLHGWMLRRREDGRRSVCERVEVRR